MIVVIAGMQRSGSTFSFNAVKKLLESRGRVLHLLTNKLEDVVSKKNISDHIVVKTHNPGPELSEAIVRGDIKCVCTVRRPEDAVLSWSNTFEFCMDDSVSTIRQWLEWHQSTSPFTINIKFKLINKWPMLSVYRIGSQLLDDIKIGEVVRISKSLGKNRIKDHVKNIDRNSTSVTDLGFSFYNSETLFHRDHISQEDSNVANRNLGSIELLELRRKLAPYVNKRGNYRWLRNKIH